MFGKYGGMHVDENSRSDERLIMPITLFVNHDNLSLNLEELEKNFKVDLPRISR